MATDEGNSQNETLHWTKDEIGVAVQSWLWVLVELIDQSVTATEQNHSVRGFKLHSDQLSMATSKNLLVVNVNTIYTLSHTPQPCDDSAQRTFQEALHYQSASVRLCRDPGIPSLYAKTQD